MDKIILSCVAVDDEQLALDKIELFISKTPFLNLKASFTNPIEAFDYLKNNKIDVLFLDIQMDEISGLQLLDILPYKPHIILTTAYEKYAVKSYELDVVDYLLKPISFERFLKAVSKIGNIFSSPSSNTKTQHIETSKNKLDFIFVKTEYRMQKVFLSDILYIEGMKDYLRFVTKVGNIMTLQNFKNVLSILPNNNFCRVHKSFIIALDKIDSIERDRITIGNKLIPIGETHREKFYKLLKNLGITFGKN